jgi:hypothetical protein
VVGGKQSCRWEVMGDGDGMRPSLFVFVNDVRFRIRDASKVAAGVRPDWHLGHTFTQYFRRRCPGAVRREDQGRRRLYTRRINSITESFIAAP